MRHHPHHDAVAASNRVGCTQPHLLCRLLGESEREGVGSVVINGNEAETPADLYRRLGFTDEVYWHATYELELS